MTTVVRWRAPALAAAVTLAAAVAHRHAGEPSWLRELLEGEGCPLAGAELDPAELERHRHESLEPLRGTTRALGRPALAFELGTTTSSEARAWLEHHGGCCEVQGRAALVCAEVTVPGELPIDSLHATLDAAGRVVSVDLLRRAGSGQAALAQLARTESELTRTVGPATARTGSIDPAYVEAHALRRVAADFDYSEYVARLSAMNFGAGAIRVREIYHSLPSAARR